MKSLFAFGSVSTENFNDSSEVDLLITFKQMDFWDYAVIYSELVDPEKAHNVLVTNIKMWITYFKEHAYIAR